MFVDGCFWHGCELHRGTRPVANDWYWRSKIEGNRARDADTTRGLEEAGWAALRFWEHDKPRNSAHIEQLHSFVGAEDNRARNSKPLAVRHRVVTGTRAHSRRVCLLVGDRTTFAAFGLPGKETARCRATE